jgi:hypothetical protein
MTDLDRLRPEAGHEGGRMPSAERLAALAARIDAAAAPELARRAARHAPWQASRPEAPSAHAPAAVPRPAAPELLVPALARLLRPAGLAAAAGLLAAVGLQLGSTPAADADRLATRPMVTAAELLATSGDGEGRAAGMPWMAEGRVPTDDDLAEALAGTGGRR